MRFWKLIKKRRQKHAAEIARLRLELALSNMKVCLLEAQAREVE